MTSNKQQKCKICSTIRITEKNGKRRLDNRFSEFCGECEEWAKKTERKTKSVLEKGQKQNDWEEELSELAEKYCKHDDRELNSCLYWIFRPVIVKALKAKDKEYEIELNHTADFQYRMGRLQERKEFIEIIKCKNCKGKGEVFVDMASTECSDCGGDGHCIKSKEGWNINQLIKQKYE